MVVQLKFPIMTGTAVVAVAVAIAGAVTGGRGGGVGVEEDEESPGRPLADFEPQRGGYQSLLLGSESTTMAAVKAPQFRRVVHGKLNEHEVPQGAGV